MTTEITPSEPTGTKPTEPMLRLKKTVLRDQRYKTKFGKRVYNDDVTTEELQWNNNGKWEKLPVTTEKIYVYKDKIDKVEFDNNTDGFLFFG